MRIEKLRINHIENPLGFAMDSLVASWVVTETQGKYQQSARIRVAMDEFMENKVYDSGERTDISSVGFEIPFLPSPRTRYYWNVEVTADNEERGRSEVAWFETGKEKESFSASWIGSPYHPNVHPVFQKNFFVKKEIKSARVYASGLGVFEIYINGEKVGDEYLAPFYTDYNNWVQYVTYDITELLQEGENAAGAMVGNGWYKGRFGFIDKLDQLYGQRFKFLAELHITYRDGTEEVVNTDSSWRCAPGEVIESSIYDGEKIDARKQIKGFATIDCDMTLFENAAMEVQEDPVGRFSPPLHIMDRRKPVELLCTPAGEQVLDFGQVMTGWVEIDCHIPEGEKVYLQFGELLQNGNFYNENLRTAKEEFLYISDGKKAHVRPHFTFYGFRYVKVSGLEQVEPKDFTACVIYSDIEEIGYLETSNEKLNQLISNTKWGQKGNFLDVPTDCPQRDERMGWTGDAQAFCATASFHMYTPAFFRKYMHDLYLEQKKLNGSVPHVVPDILRQIRCITGEKGGTSPDGSCAWGDAATVIPWTLYLFYGDKSLLSEQYESMKGWVNFIRNEDVKHCGGRYLWQTGFHFADWLALDNPEEGSSFGGTDPYYVASAYYYYSAVLTAKAAKALGKMEDAVSYENLSVHIKEALQKEYFYDNGMLKLDNQTAYVLALYFGFAPKSSRQELVKALKKKLDDNGGHLDTGFVGTAYLCLVLSEIGLDDYAYTLLLNEDYPSWLYEVNMGATTVWERWNSVLPNGLVSDTGMNSMNHYAYGAVAEWMYRGICGLNPVSAMPGFKRAIIAPKADNRLEWAKASYDSASGHYESGWEVKDGTITYHVELPFDTKAVFCFPGEYSNYTINGERVSEAQIELEPGVYEMTAVII